MRGIATGQCVNVLVVPQIEKVMNRELEKLGSDNPDFVKMDEDNAVPSDKQLLEGIVCWLISNSLDAECKAAKTEQADRLRAAKTANHLRRLNLSPTWLRGLGVGGARTSSSRVERDQ